MFDLSPATVTVLMHDGSVTRVYVNPKGHAHVTNWATPGDWIDQDEDPNCEPILNVEMHILESRVMILRGELVPAPGLDPETFVGGSCPWLPCGSGDCSQWGRHPSKCERRAAVVDSIAYGEPTKP